MTQDELQLLTQLAYKIEKTPPVQKDPEAEDLIEKRIASRPDAVYLLTQTVLIQNLALEQAQKQLNELRGGAPQRGGSFLPQSPGYGQSAPQAYQQPQQSSSFFGGMGGGGASSFLRSAGTTAAGIAAGALAFEGIRHLMGGFGGGGFGGLGFDGDQQASGLLGGDSLAEGQGYGHEESAVGTEDASYEDSGDSFDDGGGSDDSF